MTCGSTELTSGCNLQAVNDCPHPHVVVAFGFRITNCAPSQILGVVDFGAHEVLHAHRVDEQRDAAVLYEAVAFLDFLVEGEAVLKAGTTASGNEYTQLEVRVVFLPDEFADLVGGRIGKHDRWRRCIVEVLRFHHFTHPADVQPLLLRSGVTDSSSLAVGASNGDLPWGW